MEQLDVAIIGGGVVGSAIAYELGTAHPGIEVGLIESQAEPCLEASRYNAGLLHSGIHEIPGSLKATLCHEGQAKAVSFATQQQLLSLQRPGMLLVKPRGLAQHQEESYQTKKAGLITHADQLGIDYRLLNAREVEAFAPAVAADEGLFVKDVWSVDPYEFSRAIVRKAREHGAQYFCNEPVEAAHVSDHGIRLRTQSRQFGARFVINAAGLGADLVAKQLGFHDYRIFPTRGEYHQINVPSLVQGTPGAVHLVLPPNSGKGMHLFKRTGDLFVGPDRTLVQERFTVQAPEADPESFVTAARTFFPDIEPEDLSWAFSGVRARTVKADQDADFHIAQDHQRVINVVGIESPGLTASLAIGSLVASMTLKTLF